MKAPHMLYTPDNFDQRSVNHVTPPNAKDRAEMKALELKLDKPEFQAQFDNYYFCREDHEQEASMDLESEQGGNIFKAPNDQGTPGGRADPHLVFEVSNEENESDDSLGIVK